MEEVFALNREEAERLVEAMRDGPSWKCCGGPHTGYPRGNPHAHAAGCPVRDIHNALDPSGPLVALRDRPDVVECCDAQNPCEKHESLADTAADLHVEDSSGWKPDDTPFEAPGLMEGYPVPKGGLL